MDKPHPNFRSTNSG